MKAFRFCSKLFDSKTILVGHVTSRAYQQYSVPQEVSFALAVLQNNKVE